METDFLVPNATFLIEVGIALATFVAFFLWPLIDTIVRRQWGWTLFLVILGPLAGVCWLTIGKRSTHAAG